MTDIAKMRKAAEAVFLATEEDIAHDLSGMLNSAANEIEMLKKELKMARESEYGWLIEGEEKGRAVWLCIVGGHIIWSVDSNLAVRFSRVEDGASMARFLCKNLPGNTLGGLKVTDHIWSDK